MKRIIVVAFRWPIVKVDDNRIEVHIPLDLNKEPILNPNAVISLRLSEAEREASEFSALRELVIQR